MKRLFWKWWAAFCLARAEYHRDACWRPYVDILSDIECRGHIAARNRWYARYDSACAALRSNAKVLA